MILLVLVWGGKKAERPVGGRWANQIPPRHPSKHNRTHNNKLFYCFRSNKMTQWGKIDRDSNKKERASRFSRLAAQWIRVKELIVPTLPAYTHTKQVAIAMAASKLQQPKKVCTRIRDTWRSRGLIKKFKLRATSLLRKKEGLWSFVPLCSKGQDKALDYETLRFEGKDLTKPSKVAGCV